MKLVNVQEMKQLDQLATAEYAVPGILLMDNAAQAVADAVNDSLDELDGESVVVFCGGGNNGGDGFGAARWLQNYGARVRVFVVGKALDAVTGDAAAELAMLQKTDAKVEAIASEDDWLLAELAAAKADLLVTAAVCKGDFIPNLILKIGVCVAAIYLFASAAYTITLSHEEYVVESKQIVSLNDKDKLSGAFVLGSGAVNETSYYVYNYKLH